MGMGKFRPPVAPETLRPEWISMNLEYIGGVTTHANPHGAATVGGLGEHVTCYVFRFLRGNRLQNGSPYAIGPLSVCPHCL